MTTITMGDRVTTRWGPDTITELAGHQLGTWYRIILDRGGGTTWARRHDITRTTEEQT